MKVDFAAIRRAEASARGSQGKRILVPAIPLERPAVKQYKNKTQLISLKLRTDPANADSPVYEKTIPVFIDGDAEEWLIRKKDILQALAGLNIHGAQQSTPWLVASWPVPRWPSSMTRLQYMATRHRNTSI
jgi:hypothetical protein